MYRLTSQFRNLDDKLAPNLSNLSIVTTDPRLDQDVFMAAHNDSSNSNISVSLIAKRTLEDIQAERATPLTTL